MTMPRLASSRWWYIMPIVFVTYSLAYLDRANYGFAAASGMADDLRITPGLSSLLGVRESEINQEGKARKLWDIEEGKGI